MITIKKGQHLKYYQEYVREMEIERGFDHEDALQKALLLGEEMGELFKAIRKVSKNMKIDETSKVGTLEEEFADVFIYLCSIANRFNINLEEAFCKKEEYNKTRIWK